MFDRDLHLLVVSLHDAKYYDVHAQLGPRNLYKVVLLLDLGRGFIKKNSFTVHIYRSFLLRLLDTFVSPSSRTFVVP